MAKTKRKNFLIDRPFQLGFIFRYLLIIFSTIILMFLSTILFLWLLFTVGNVKIDFNVYYTQKEHLKVDGKYVYVYDKEKISVIEEVQSNGSYNYVCYSIDNNSSTTYKVGDIIQDIDETSLIPRIDDVKKSTNIFLLILLPLLITWLILFSIIIIYSIFFTHRIAGLIYRLKVSLDRMLSDDYDFVIKVRSNDFFKNIAERLEKLRQKLRNK